VQNNLYRRQILTAIGIAASALVLPINTQKEPRKKPNFLFLLTDDQRFNTLHALNNPEVHTPNMDTLVRSGTAFTHAFIMGSTNPAVCILSRAMLMTGQSLFRVNESIVSHEKMSNPAQRPFITFLEVLRHAGYTTFATGKWHNDQALFKRCFSQGENVFFGGMSDHLKVPVVDYDPSEQYPEQKQRLGNAFSSTLFANSTIKFLREGKSQGPHLIYVAFTAPHDPRMAPKQYLDLYPLENISLPTNFMPEHPFDNGEIHIRDEELVSFPRTPEIVRREIAGYYAMITEVDAQIGRVLTALEESGETDNTYIIFSSDNGLAVGQHGLMGKQNLYDHSVRVPLIICGPGVPKGKTTDALCYLMDISPTILELAGQSIPNSIEGKSLVPLLKNQKVRIRDSVFLAYRNLQRGVRTDRWKLIVYTVGGKKTVQLFDLANDPMEIKNLANEASQAGRVRELTVLLKQHMQQTGDSLNLDNVTAS